MKSFLLVLAMFVSATALAQNVRDEARDIALILKNEGVATFLESRGVSLKAVHFSHSWYCNSRPWSAYQIVLEKDKKTCTTRVTVGSCHEIYKDNVNFWEHDYNKDCSKL